MGMRNKCSPPTHTHTRSWYEKVKFVYFTCSSWFPLYIFGHSKYALTCCSMKKANFCFSKFLRDFIYKFLGLQSMRLPTVVWRVCIGYERQICAFLLFSFVISLINVWVCKVCGPPSPCSPYRPWYEEYASGMKGIFVLFLRLLNFHRDFLLKFLGMQSMRLPTVVWRVCVGYERQICVFLLFSF